MEFGQNEEKHSEVLIGKDVKRVKRNRSERGRWRRAALSLLLSGRVTPLTDDERKRE
jgi:hypothetical protein